MMASDKKITKCAEIVRLQDALKKATPRYPPHTVDPEYTRLVDDYLSFLLRFVGDTEYDWSSKRLVKINNLMTRRADTATVEALDKIPEDMIPAVAVREMLLGDDNGPWMHAMSSPLMVEFLSRYPFVLDRTADA